MSLLQCSLVLALLRVADAAGLTVNVDGDRLVIRGPRSADATARALIEHKPEIVMLLSDEHLSDRKHASVLPPDDQVETPDRDVKGFPKLAAVGAGIPDDWRQGVCKLIALPCPASVRPPRWHRLQLDAAAFYETWAAQAAALGWSTYDVFGANRTRPIERVDMAGLVVLINGRGLAALTDTEAAISTRTSASLTYRQKWIEPAPGRVLLWELGNDTDTGH